jgi:hypothetical protein
MKGNYDDVASIHQIQLKLQVALHTLLGRIEARLSVDLVRGP